MDKLALLLFSAYLLFLLYKWRKQSLLIKQKNLIDSYQFPAKISQRLRVTYPHLNEQQTDQVVHGLREYFHICNIAGNKRIAMPSQAVDVAWHEFILFTREYQGFCTRALGRFLHHTPAEAMHNKTSAQESIKKVWKIACYREKISEHNPEKLPLLFALDAQLAIPDGFKYSLNCKNSHSANDYCVSHIGCSSGCASDSDSSSDTTGCSGGCSGGCGGD